MLSELKKDNLTDKKVFNKMFLNDAKGVKAIMIKRDYQIKELFLDNKSISTMRIDSDKDYYICINDLYKHERTNVSARGLNGFYIDIDYYTKNLTEEMALSYLYQVLDDKNIFMPTMIYSSGRGLYLLWKIEKVFANSDKVMKLWQQVQNDLIDAFSDIGADSKVKANSNLIRLPGSYNQKNGQRTALLDYTGNIYTLEEFKEEVSTYKAKPVKKKVKHLYNAYNLNVSRVYDIERLFELRGFDCRGVRNEMLFVYRNYLNLSGDEQAKQKVIEMNDKLIEPLSRKELGYLNQARKQYIFKNETIIKHLLINDEEQKELKSIINDAERRRRRKIYDDERYKPIKQENKRKKQERDIKVLEMLEQGYSVTEIAKKTGLSRPTIYAIKKV